MEATTDELIKEEIIECSNTTPYSSLRCGEYDYRNIRWLCHKHNTQKIKEVLS